MGALESVYSYVFGDGDPNEGLEQEQLRRAASYIRSRNGVVVAEELAPFFDPPAAPPKGTPAGTPTGPAYQALEFSFASDSEGFVDEQWVLPVVLALGGLPSVTADGDIVYTFEELRSTATLPPGLSPASERALSRAADSAPEPIEVRYSGWPTVVNFASGFSWLQRIHKKFREHAPVLPVIPCMLPVVPCLRFLLSPFPSL